MSIAALSFDFASLAAALRAGLSLADLYAEVIRRVGSDPHRAWITPPDPALLAPYLAALEARRGENLPLFGLPFAVKDNIDVADMRTTAACPAFGYVPGTSATVVQRLVAAGAVPVGKTNLDQFATGLNGTRSPYGACHNSFDPRYISGGSSSGSAVAVALGQVSFSLGTDTAGSGRVPAAFNNILGLKASLGVLPTTGVVPACRSLDCVSVFALNAPDAGTVLRVARGPDPADAYSRDAGAGVAPAVDVRALRVGVPAAALLDFDGDTEGAAAFDATVKRLADAGAQLVAIDFAPFRDAARLLYAGAWVAERYAAVGEFIDAHPGDVLPVIRDIIQPGKALSAVDAFRDGYQLRALRRLAEAQLARVDLLVTPTAPRIYTIDQLHADPIGANSRLGTYTNYLNLLDLCAVAVPAALLPGGLPFGVTLVATALQEDLLLHLADRLQRQLPFAAGAPVQQQRPAPGEERTLLAVCGAHMRGLPLNGQLLELQGRFVAESRTAPVYRLYALPGGPPWRPGLLRVAEGGAAVALEIWEIPSRHAGAFLAKIPAPLGLGRIELEGGQSVSGFLCESVATLAARDITHHGGWRAFLQSDASTAP